MVLLRSGLFVFVCNVAEILCTFLRNIILARLLGVEDFGIAATFSLLVLLLDIAAQLGLGRMVVQAHDADDPKLQATLHTVQFVLGVVSGLLIFVTAGVYASFMATPTLTWAYASLGIIPIMRGLSHLDSQRLQRVGRFGPAAIRQLAPQIVALIAIYPAYLWLGDYRVALVTILFQQLVMLLASHYGATWRFAMAFDSDVFRRAFAFGWPMMVNSLVMYFVLNGDRMVVSHLFGLQALGWFSAATMLTLMPMNLIAKTMQTLLLPSMSKQQHNPAQLQRQYEMSISAIALVGLVFLTGIWLFGELVLVLTFGPDYASAAVYLVLLTVMQWFRILRAAPALVAMARAETKNPLLTNIVRGFFIVIAFGVAILTRNILLMILCGVVGELIAAIYAGWLARRMIGIAVTHLYAVLGTTTLVSAAISLIEIEGWPIWVLAPCLAVFLYSVRAFLAEHRRFRTAF
jgi:O-antigen/teichoic acid export membrane protein